MNYKETIEYIRVSPKITMEKSYEIATLANKLLSNGEKGNRGREIVIRMIDAWDRIDSKTHELWSDLTESAGLYPYITPDMISGASCLRYEFHKSLYLKDIYLHEEQMQLSLLLHGERSLIVSAPTSFGKSLLIEEIIASKRHCNIVIIQPTLALLDETRKKLQKYYDTYGIIVCTSQRPERDRNIFLFTGERVVEYQQFPQVDFFIIDEFYKLSPSREDERAPILNCALYKLMKMTQKFYLLGPSIRSIPDGFASKSGATWIKSDFATVAIDRHSISSKTANGRKQEKEKILYELLTNLADPTLIYCSAPGKANNLVSGFLHAVEKDSYHTQGSVSSNNENIAEWIDKNIHPEWDLRNALVSGIGIHHGALPRHLASSIVDSFNCGHIRYLFCTSTLIEGVNTSARNVVLYDRKKGRKSIDYFDFKNITGRAGRMSYHYIGKIFEFHPEPEQIELDIDIPVFTQVDAPLELLIQLDPRDIKPEVKSKLDLFSQLEKPIRNLLMKNSGISVDGQLALINEISNDFSTYQDSLCWSQLPTYDQLSFIIDLGWRHLLKKSESKGGAYSAKQLAYIVLQYSRYKSINVLINRALESKYWVEKLPNRHERIQAITNSLLQIQRHWFDYKLPKLLGVMSDLQAYVSKKMEVEPGNYTMFAKQIENRFVQPNLAILFEFDIPASAMRKLSKHIDSEIVQKEVLQKIQKLDLKAIGLLSYEILKLKQLPEVI